MTGRFDYINTKVIPTPSSISFEEKERSNVFINATVFKRPDGRKELITCHNVYKDDADYINKHDIKVSMETIDEYTNNHAVYFDYGLQDSNGEPVEVIVISDGARSCEECIKEGVSIIQRRKEIQDEVAINNAIKRAKARNW